MAGYDWSPADAIHEGKRRYPFLRVRWHWWALGALGFLNFAANVFQMFNWYLPIPTPFT